MMVTFQSYPYTAKATFTCASCGKANRTKSFRVECTVNPYNRGPDGIPLNASQVRAQSKEEALEKRHQFMTKPVCKACEDQLSFRDRKRLYDERRALSADNRRSEMA